MKKVFDSRRRRMRPEQMSAVGKQLLIGRICVAEGGEVQSTLCHAFEEASRLTHHEQDKGVEVIKLFIAQKFSDQVKAASIFHCHQNLLVAPPISTPHDPDRNASNTLIALECSGSSQ